jgi:hypothetical protein
MADKKLLELAAKAAGIEFDVRSEEEFCTRTKSDVHWNPLTDDGDALRLAVQLGLAPHSGRLDGCCVVTSVNDSSTYIVEPFNSDPYAATRRAIVRAAAEIGKDMK